MAPARITLLMIVSLMLNLVFSGLQGSPLHTSLMEHASVSDHSAHTSLMAHASVSEHSAHSANTHPDSSDQASADDCRLKCILAMCVSGSALPSAGATFCPRRSPVLLPLEPVFLSQSLPDNPFRPPIAA